MKCKNCGEEFDESLFPYCPCCLEPLTEDIKNKTIVSDEIIEENLNILQYENKEGFDSEIQIECDSLSEDFLLSQEEDLIEDIFWPNSCHIFRTYCKKNNLIYMNDLDGFNFSVLFGLPGIGKGKYEKILEIYNSYCIDHNNENKNSNIIDEKFKTKKIFVDINNEILDLNINYFYSMINLPKSAKKQLEHYNLNTIGDLKKLSGSDLSQIMKESYYSRVLEFEKYITLKLKDFFISYINVCIGDKLIDVCIRRYNGQSLEEISNKYDVTREYIRLRESKALQLLDIFAKDIINSFVNDCDIVYVSDIDKIFNDERLNKLVLFWLSNSTEYSLFRDFNCYVKGNNKIEDELKHKICELANKNSSLDFIVEELDPIITLYKLNFIEEANIINYLKELGYLIFDRRVYKEKLTFSNMIPKIVSKYFPEGIHIYDHEELNKVRDYIYSNFKRNADSNDRALSARMSDCLVLRGRGFYVSPDRVDFPSDLLEEIHDYIVNTKESTVTYAEIFDVFEGKLKYFTDVDNYNYLHGILNLFFSEEFENDRDCIMKKGKENKKQMHEKIKDYLLLKGEPQNKKDILKNVKGLNEPYLNNIMADRNNSIFQWDTQVITCREIMNIDKTFIDMLIQKIDSIHNNLDGYCTSRILLNIVDDDILEKYNIDSHLNLYFICKEYFGGVYELNNPYILKKNVYSSSNSVDIIKQKLGNPKQFDYETFSRICRECYMPKITVSMVLSELEEEYLRINREDYLNKGFFKIDDSQIIEVDNVIQDNIIEGFLPAVSLTHFEQLPEVNCEWNEFLLCSYVQNFSRKFKLIEPLSKDRRFTKSIIVSKDSEINDYETLIKQFLENKNISKISEDDLMQLLVMNDFIYKSIPKELYKSEVITYKNGYFIL